MCVCVWVNLGIEQDISNRYIFVPSATTSCVFVCYLSTTRTHVSHIGQRYTFATREQIEEKVQKRNRPHFLHTLGIHQSSPSFIIWRNELPGLAGTMYTAILLLLFHRMMVVYFNVYPSRSTALAIRRWMCCCWIWCTLHALHTIFRFTDIWLFASKSQKKTLRVECVILSRQYN